MCQGPSRGNVASVSLLTPLWVWVAANPDRAAAAAVATVVYVCRKIPPATYTRWAKRWPRGAAVYRFLRAMGPDVVKAGRAIKALKNGEPIPEDCLPPSILDVPRAVEPSAMHHRPTLPGPAPAEPENDH